MDLDGTLLDSQHQLSDRNKAAIRAAQAAGIKLAIATGKTRASALPIIEEMALKLPGVFVQGLIIYEGDGRVRHETVLDPAIARATIEYAETHGLPVLAYAGDRLLTREHVDEVMDIARFHEPLPEIVGPLIDLLDHTPIHKLIIFCGNTARTEALRAELTERIGEHVSFTTAAMIESLEVLPKNTSKGAGVAQLLRDLDVKPQHTMAIGDAENDLSMLELVGWAVAVGNASEGVKQLADVVVSTNDEGGVAEAIERFALR